MRLLTLFLYLSLASVLFAEELMPHKADNLSLRNEVQLAIDKGLFWLEKNQNADGSWSVNDTPALTALPLSAFMGEPSGKYRSSPPEFIKKGYDFLLSCAQPDGGVYRKGLANYNTSLS